MSKTPIQQRLSITFGKLGALKYIGNLDTAKVWERVLRRADLPILYTQGFNTRPRMQLASALPLGITSECEILDVSMREIIDPDDSVIQKINDVSPEGLRVYAIESVPIDNPPLQTLVRSSEYRIHIEDETSGELLHRDELHHHVETILAAERIVKETTKKSKRRKSYYDMRPMILNLDVVADGELVAHLSAGERGNLHPRELIAEMGLEDFYYTIHRYKLHMDDYYERHRRIMQESES